MYLKPCYDFDTMLWHRWACFEFFLTLLDWNIFISSWCRWCDLYESRIGNHNNSPPHLISHGSVITNVTLIPIKITKNKNHKNFFQCYFGRFKQCHCRVNLWQLSRSYFWTYQRTHFWTNFWTFPPRDTW